MYSNQVSPPVPAGGLSNQLGVLTDPGNYRGHHLVLLKTDHFPEAALVEDWLWLCGHYSEFTSRNALVVGLNGHQAEANRRFVEQHQLPFDIISDSGGLWSQQLDAGRPGTEGASLYLINPDGRRVKWSSGRQLRDEMKVLLGYLDSRCTIGDNVPDATVYQLSDGAARPRDARAFFQGRRVVLFAVPGAFTPGCSAEHLPGYVQQADRIRARGVDDIICLAINDPFVMEAWGQSQSVGRTVSMVSDGDAEFTRAMGMVTDLGFLGLGLRSRRYAMVVEDGVIVHLNVEAEHRVDRSSAAVMAALL